MSISTVALLLLTAVVAFAASLSARRPLPSLAALDTAPWSSMLSHLATAYGIVLGSSIVFPFGGFVAIENEIRE